MRTLALCAILAAMRAAGEVGRQGDPPVYPPPATQPAERPVNPFGPPSYDRADAVPGCLELSDGRLAVGRIYTTRDKPLTLWDRALKRRLPIPMRSIRRIAAHLEWAREEPEWRWREMGSDDKLYTGRSYPVLKVYYTVTLLDDRQFTGDFVPAPLYVTDGKEPVRFILWQRHKGDFGQTLADLRYIREVRFGEEAAKAGRQALEKEPTRLATTQEGEPPRDRPPIFVGDPDNKTVHRHTCRRTMKIPLPVGFLTLAEALAAGYRACGECRPVAHTAPTTRPAAARDTRAVAAPLSD